MSDNKQIIIERIWDNPAPILGGEWKQTRNAWQTPNGTIRLLRTASGNNISVFGNHASGFAGMRYDIFTYIQDKILNTSDFWDTLQSCARVYNVELKLSSEQRERIERAQLAREVAPSLVSALMENRTGEAWAYLSDTRGIEPDGTHYGELTADSIKRAKDALKARSLTYSDADFKALGLTDERARNGYNIVLPYFRNGAVVGFIFRNTKGREPKYLYSEGLERGGYCDRLTQGKPAVIVEGQLDALRLMSAGVTNVIAMGGAESGDVLAQLLHAHDIKQITYLPDMEFKEGKQRTDLIDKAIKRFQSLRVDGEPVITQLYVAAFQIPEGATLSDYKTDADTYGKEQGAKALRDVVKTAREWWDYELIQLEDWEAGEREAGRYADKVEIERRFMDIYKRCTSPTERERMRWNIDGVELYQHCGITRAALLDVDEQQRQNEYNDKIRANVADLNKAIEGGINPAKISEIVAKLNTTQHTNTRDEWEQQLNRESYEDELRAISEQRDTMQTKWALGVLAKDKNNPAIIKFCKLEQVEFYPADITVFCAPTSHGKTMILFQSALDLVRENKDKTFLFVSCEENKRQLTERALNVYLDIPTSDTGRDNVQRACFVKRARKRSIKAAIQGTRPKNVPIYDTNPALWEELKARLFEGFKRYGEEIRPRLRFVHTEGSAESIAANIRHYVEQYRADGVEVGGVFVDYMQLLTSDSNNYSRHDELKEICKALHDCAACIDLPIIIAAQLNRYAIAEGIDSVTVANIGEGADIERIAHDIFLVWQVDKTKQDLYYRFENKDKTQEPKRVLDITKLGDRSRRIFSKTGGDEIELKRGYLYVEQMKARDGEAGGWGLFPFDGERGFIGELDEEIMKK